MDAESRHPDGTRAECSGGVSDARLRRRIEGEWIAAMAEWTWWSSLTFQAPVGEARAKKILFGYLRALAQDLAQESGQHFRAAWCMEYQGRDVPHFHTLIDYPTTEIDLGAARLYGEPEEREVSPAWLECRWLSTDWAAGNVHVERYDPARGAAFYLVKGGRWDLHVACPRLPSCRRRLGCTFARKIGW
jgi:hypothetical protein